MFAAWGRFVHRRRWLVLVVSAVLLGASVALLLRGGTLTTGGPLRSNLQSAQAANLVASELAQGNSGGSSFLLIFRSSSLTATDAGFRQAVEAALAPLQGDRRVTAIGTPYNAAAPAVAAALISRDGHEALVSVGLKSTGREAQDAYAALRPEVHAEGLTVTGTGNAAINRAFNTTLETDLRRAELITLPVTLLLLVLIFGSVVAAGLPLGVGVLTILAGLAGTYFLTRFTDVSQYALNIVTLIGLAVSIDYSLFIVNRFRDELARGVTREEALATAMATAGRAITFSGVTVAIGLSGLLFYSGTFLSSMGMAGAIAVAMAVVYALTFLPAVLSLLGPRVDRLHVPGFRHRHEGGGAWHAIASRVMRRPWLFLLPTVAVLLVAGTPFFGIRLANGDVQMLPTRVEARQGYDRLLADFPGRDETTIQVVVDYPDGNPTLPARVAAENALTARMKALPHVLSVNPGGAGKHIVLFNVTTNLAPESDGARDIVRAIRADPGVGGGGTVLVDGQTGFDMDVIQFILEKTPIAVAFVVATTLLVLFLLTGSVVLPLKAVLLNLLSIGASFGALVWMFQQGHLANVLGFTPQSIDPTIPVILFSIVFGMSMDYEVLLLSRIQEEYRRTGDNTASVAEGLQRSGRLITGAAFIMVAVFLAFGVAEVVVIKAIGLGLAIAVALDATLVRALVVPAFMRLLGDVNWWAPGPLRRLYERAGLGETSPAKAPVGEAA